MAERDEALMAENLATTAQRIATQAHVGQTDKAGRPYIGHPSRVAARLAGDEQAEAAAWLHDVLEDTVTTATDLAALGIPATVVAAVEALTRRNGEAPDDYYARVAANPLALTVKQADIADNADPQRLAQLDPAVRQRLRAKYDHAREVLDKLAAAQRM
jgi:(p)ppGpp synthase/HD superfamily hydrolase